MSNTKNEIKIFTSKLWSVNWYDVGQGFIMAVGAPLLYYLQTLIPGWDNPLLQSAISAGVTYIIKKFLTPSTVIIRPVQDIAIDKIDEIK